MFLGTDPELFLRDAKTGSPVPAHRLLGDKHNKTQLKDSTNAVYASIFRDGYAVEVNLASAGSCFEGLAYRTLRAMRAVKDLAATKGLTIDPSPMVRIRPEDLADAPEDVMTFGCEPSWDAYTGQVKMPAIDAATHMERYAGGHLHLSVPSYNNNAVKVYGSDRFRDPEYVTRLVRWFDMTVGIPLTLLFASHETFRRREFYGQAGEFRFQTYGRNAETGKPNYTGVEYRTPGPEVWNHPAIASFAIRRMRALAYMDHPTSSYRTLPAWDDAWSDDVRDVINHGADPGKLPIHGLGRPDKDSWFEHPEMFEMLLKQPGLREPIAATAVPIDNVFTNGWITFASIGRL